MTMPGDTFTVSLEGGIPLSDLVFSEGLGLSESSGAAIQSGMGEPVLSSVTLPISDLSTSLTAEHFAQFAGIGLQPNSFYWIDLNASVSPEELETSPVGWGTTGDNTGPGVSAGYNSSDPTDFFFFPNNRDGGEQAFQMEVSGTAVPEPSTWVLMLAGFGGLALIAYRRRAMLAFSRA
jgi:PEP-CTERM motif